MSSPPVRVVGPAALKALMAYGGKVHDLRLELDPAGSSPAAEGVVADRLAGRVAGSGAAPDDLILLLADDVGLGKTAEAALIDALPSLTNRVAGHGAAMLVRVRSRDTLLPVLADALQGLAPAADTVEVDAPWSPSEPGWWRSFSAR